MAKIESAIRNPYFPIGWISLAALIVFVYFFGLTIPLVGPDWRLAKLISSLLGAPIPDHVLETLHRGRLADNSRMGELLGFTPAVTTMDVIDRLYAWPTVVRIPARQAVA